MDSFFWDFLGIFFAVVLGLLEKFLVKSEKKILFNFLNKTTAGKSESHNRTKELSMSYIKNKRQAENSDNSFKNGLFTNIYGLLTNVSECLLTNVSE